MSNIVNFKERIEDMATKAESHNEVLAYERVLLWRSTPLQRACERSAAKTKITMGLKEEGKVLDCGSVFAEKVVLDELGVKS